ncbi:MAG: sensor histidine kinase [Mucilaginibacter sp.]
MKKKLNTIFILIALALLGIIIFQIYWTVNAYKVNKEKFDANINAAMQNAMDDCKKDYFDSIRRVLIKHLASSETTIRIDTLQNRLAILFLTQKSFPGEPYVTSEQKLNYYRTKINHKATIPEVITEMSFYEPKLIRQIMDAYDPFMGHSFNSNDMRRHPEFFKSWTFKGKPMSKIYFSEDKLTNDLPSFYQHLRDSAIIAYFTDQKKKDTLLLALRKKSKTSSRQALSIPPPVANTTTISPIATKTIQPPLSQGSASTKKDINVLTADHHSQYLAGIKAFELQMQNSIFGTPTNYRLADSLKLTRYLESELQKKNIYSKFKLTIKTITSAAAKSNLNFSETNEVEYKYFGFKVFGNGPNSLFIRAEFNSPLYNVLRNMIFLLLLSLILIVFVIFCFNYIIKTFIEQKKLADLKDDFINNMTHELKTPIATITVAIEGMQKFNVLQDTEKTQRYLQTSRNELSRLNDLVTKVLDIASFENKAVELVKTTVDINLLIEDIIGSEKAKTSKLVNITYKKANDINYIRADNIHFRNVLVNLIDNAVKYSNEPVEIVITIKKSANNVVVSVKDNGIGIPQSHLTQVFDKFHRVPTGNVHNVKGTGLGLSYVKYFVEAHGGAIAVKSEVNKGSEFMVTLPIDNE